MSRALRFLAVLCLVSAVSAQSQPAVPSLTGRIVDLAKIMSPAAKAALTERLAAHEDSTTNQIAVLTIPSLNGEVLEEYATRVFREWGLGTAEADNGVLVLVARDDRKIRIEVGYGLEGSLTDARAGRIIRGEATPRFKDRDYDGGVTATVEAILAVVDGRGEYVGPPPRPGFWFTVFGLVCLAAGGGLWTVTWREGVDRVPVAQNMLWGLFASAPMYPVVRVVTAHVSPAASEGMRWYTVLIAGAVFWIVVAVTVEGVWWRRPRRSRWRRLNSVREKRASSLHEAAVADKRTIRIEPGLFGGEVAVIDGKAIVKAREKAKREEAKRERDARHSSSSSSGGFSGGGGSSGGGGASGGW